MKGIALPEFIAEQIASRIKIGSREDKKLAGLVNVKTAKGEYVSKGGEKHFSLEVSSDPRDFRDLANVELQDMVLGMVFKTAADVIRGYWFSDFEYVRVDDNTGRGPATVTRDDLERFRKKKAKLEQVIRR